MWGRKPPGLGQARKDREAREKQPLDDSYSDGGYKRYTGEQGTCPHCGSTNSTPINEGRKEYGNERSHCNSCYRSYSPTARTEYHKSYLTSNQRNLLRECAREGMSQAEIAEIVGVNKNTVTRYIKIFEESGGQELEEALKRDAAQAAYQELQQELLDEQD